MVQAHTAGLSGDSLAATQLAGGMVKGGRVLGQAFFPPESSVENIYEGQLQPDLRAAANLLLPPHGNLHQRER